MPWETVLVNLSSDGNPLQLGNNFASMSGDGRYVLFVSTHSGVPLDQNEFRDLYVRDRVLNTTTLVTVGFGDIQSDGNSDEGSISPSGRYVVFHSTATNLIPNDTNGVADLFLRDLVDETTTRITVTPGGGELPLDAATLSGRVSDVGPTVVYYSGSSLLAEGVTNQVLNIFRFHLPTLSNTRISVSQTGVQGNGHSRDPVISSDGRWVAFNSRSTNLIDGQALPVPASDYNTFIHDFETGLVKLVSGDLNGNLANRDSNSLSISGNGRFVAFHSEAMELAPGFSEEGDIYLRDCLLGTTVRVSDHTLGFGGPGRQPSISECGRYVAFHSKDTDLVWDDDNDSDEDIFIRDTWLNTTTLVSYDSAGEQGNGESENPQLTSDGSGVVFLSDAELAPNSPQNVKHFVFRKLFDAVVTTTCFEDFCVASGPTPLACGACPCANNAPPGSAGGCLNEAGGSARLIASGVPSIAVDTLHFDLDGGVPSALNILVSAVDRAPANPIHPCFGTDRGTLDINFDGLRCVQKQLKRHGARQSDLAGDVGSNGYGWGYPAGPPEGLIANAGFVAGQVRHFQTIYRTDANTNCMRGLNTSQGVTVTFEP